MTFSPFHLPDEGQKVSARVLIEKKKPWSNKNKSPLTGVFGSFDVAQKNTHQTSLGIALTGALNSNLMSSEDEGNEEKKENGI